MGVKEKYPDFKPQTLLCLYDEPLIPLKKLSKTPGYKGLCRFSLGLVIAITRAILSIYEFISNVLVILLFTLIK